MEYATILSRFCYSSSPSSLTYNDRLFISCSGSMLAATLLCVFFSFWPKQQLLSVMGHSHGRTGKGGSQKITEGLSDLLLRTIHSTHFLLAKTTHMTRLVKWENILSPYLPSHSHVYFKSHGNIHGKKNWGQ